jgi:hypothetical protein
MLHLHARLEAIIKEVEDAEAQVVAARRRAQAARLILEEEESKATALEQTTTAVRHRVPSSVSSSSFPVVASQLVPVTPRVTLFPNYLHYKLNQASSVMVNQVVEVRNQNSKSGVQI